MLRNATIKCETNCHFAILSKECFGYIVKAIEYAAICKYLDFLKKTPWFKHLSMK